MKLKRSMKKHLTKPVADEKVSDCHVSQQMHIGDRDGQARTDKDRLILAMVGTFTTDESTGGPATHIRNLTNAMTSIAKIEIHIISKGKTDKVIKRPNITIHVLRTFGLYILGEILHAWRVRNEISKIDPDVVHYQGISPYLLFDRGDTSLLTVHGLFSEEVPLRMKGWKYFVFGIPRLILERIILPRVNNIIAVSPYIEVAMASTRNVTTKVIPNGVDIDFFDISEEEEPNRLLFVGRIERRKGLLNLIRALKVIKCSIPSVKLVVVGEKGDLEYFGRFCGLVEDEGLTSNVAYKGKVGHTELKKEYQKCSVFILPSEEEPFGIVLLEAMASCRPVVATNVGGIPSVIENGKNGFLVEPGNHDELAEKTLFLLTNERARRRMGLEGMRIAKNYEWTKIARDTVNFYNRIILSKNRNKQRIK